MTDHSSRMAGGAEFMRNIAIGEDRFREANGSGSDVIDLAT